MGPFFSPLMIPVSLVLILVAVIYIFGFFSPDREASGVAQVPVRVLVSPHGNKLIRIDRGDGDWNNAVLNGVIVPREHGRCSAPFEDCSRQIARVLKETIEGKKIECVYSEPHRRSIWFRIIITEATSAEASCSVSGESVGAILIKSGWALAGASVITGGFYRNLLDAEQYARENKRGFWQGEGLQDLIGFDGIKHRPIRCRKYVTNDSDGNMVAVKRRYVPFICSFRDEAHKLAHKQTEKEATEYELMMNPAGYADAVSANVIQIGEQKIRLHGIIGPEEGDTCGSPTGDCAEQARKYLDRLLILGRRRNVTRCSYVDIHRITAKCSLEWNLLRNGWAVIDPTQYDKLSAITGLSTEEWQGPDKGMWKNGKLPSIEKKKKKISQSSQCIELRAALDKYQKATDKYKRQHNKPRLPYMCKSGV